MDKQNKTMSKKVNWSVRGPAEIWEDTVRFVTTSWEGLSRGLEAPGKEHLERRLSRSVPREERQKIGQNMPRIRYV